MRLTSTEVARAVGVSVKHVHYARRAGYLRACRTGSRHWYYEPNDVRTWVERYSPSPRPVSRNPTGDSSHPDDDDMETELSPG